MLIGKNHDQPVARYKHSTVSAIQDGKNIAMEFAAKTVVTVDEIDFLVKMLHLRKKEENKTTMNTLKILLHLFELMKMN